MPSHLASKTYPFESFGNVVAVASIGDGGNGTTADTAYSLPEAAS